MRGLLLRLIIVGLFLAPGLAFANEMPDKTALSLNVLIKEALANNPGLQAARYRVDAARARSGIMIDLPDPMLEYEYDKITPGSSSMGGDKVRAMETVAVSQTIPFPTKLLLKKDAAHQEALAAERDYKENERRVIREIKDSYYNLSLNRQKSAYLNDSLLLMRQLVDVTSKKYAVSQAGQQDLMRAQVEYGKLSNMVKLYETEASIANSLLLSLLGRRDNQPLVISDKEPEAVLALSETDAVALALRNRWELQSARAMLEKARAESSLSKQELIPDLTLKYKRELKDGKFSGVEDGAWSGMVGINVPVWFWGKQSSGIRQARANLESAKAQYQAAENQAVYDARSAYARFDAARYMVKMYETSVIPQAASSAATARRAYESGQMGFTDLLESLRMLRELQTEYFEALAQQKTAMAELELATAASLTQ